MKQMELIAVIKTAWTIFLGWISSVLFFFLPIKDLMNGLLLAFGLSFIFGIVAGLRVQGESISKKKAFTAFGEIAVYLLILASLFTIGDTMNDSDMIYEILGTITWGMIYFYIASFLKNTSRLIPSSRGLKYIHYVISMEFLKKNPSIKEFEDNEKANETI